MEENKDDLGRFISVNTKGLIEEIMQSNEHTWILKIPLMTLYELLRQVASRCNEINDPRLNELMLRLNMYEMPNEARVKMIRQMIKKQEKQWYYFTFASASEYGNKYVKFYGTYSEAREQMLKHFGDKWAFQYDEKGFAGQIEMYGLQEIEL